jgi:hypothetical protein
LAAKANGIGLVTTNVDERLSDFSPAGAAEGAQIGSATKDGLIFYPSDERLTAANLRCCLIKRSAKKTAWVQFRELTKRLLGRLPINC